MKYIPKDILTQIIIIILLFILSISCILFCCCKPCTSEIKKKYKDIEDEII